MHEVKLSLSWLMQQENDPMQTNKIKNGKKKSISVSVGQSSYRINTL